MSAYYNEFDPNAAAWLRELIERGLIAKGEVDDRSIIDVSASDLRGFTQHHFFAGIGVWSFALRNAGWPDDRPVCTASLPCQPFSAAGKRKGKDDERHLLPHFLDLVKECDFPILFGEQVAPAIKQGWLDDLYDEMEQQGYTCGSSVLTAAGAGAPHIRQRLYWAATRMAYSDGLRQQGKRWSGSEEKGASEYSEVSGMENAEGQRIRGTRPERHGEKGENEACWRHANGESFESIAGGPADAAGIEWLYCRDEKYRPIKSGITPLVDGSAGGMGHSSDSGISPNKTSEARVMRLKGYGNAIQAQTAQLFIESVMETLDDILTPKPIRSGGAT